MPDAWRAVSLDWSALNRPHRGSAHRDLAWAPGPAAEAMLYQTLVGCWPPELAPDDAAGRAALTERVVQWQTKALREAKRHTDWLAPDIRYERDCEAFVRAILKPRGAGDFAHRLHAFVARIAPAGVVNSLTQAVLRMASPGVPDLYQDLSHGITRSSIRTTAATCRSRRSRPSGSTGRSRRIWRRGPMRA